MHRPTQFVADSISPLQWGVLTSIAIFGAAYYIALKQHEAGHEGEDHGDEAASGGDAGGGAPERHPTAGAAAPAPRQPPVVQQGPPLHAEGAHEHEV